MAAKLTCVDLFTGIAGLYQSIAPIVDPLLYCDINPDCRALLRSRMASGDIPHAPIVADVRNWSTMQELVDGRRVDLILSSSSCVGFSTAGTGKGLDHPETRLFGETIKIMSKLRPRFVFFENVPGIMAQIDQIREEFTCAGFKLHHLTISASDVGAWHVRRRWFGLAVNREMERDPDLEDELLERLDAMPPFDWDHREVPDEMIARPGDLSETIKRIQFLGNSVVPDQARAAFITLMREGVYAGKKRRPWKTIVRGRVAKIDEDTQEPAKEETKVVRFVLDPALQDPSDSTARCTRALITEPMSFQYYSSPRFSQARSSNILTERTINDLPTQCRFATKTRGPRNGFMNPAFLEFLMAFETGYTRI